MKSSPRRGGGDVPARERRPREDAYVSVGHPVVYWRGVDLILHEPLSGKRLVVAPFAVHLLHVLRRPQTVASLRGRFPDAPAAALDRALSDLISHGLVATATARGRRPPHPLDAWGTLAPEASFYHFATRDPVIAHGRRVHAIEARLERAAEPDDTPRVVRADERQQLAHEPSADAFTDVLRTRRTWRVFDGAPVPHERFSRLLQLTFGVQQWARSPGGRPIKLKTSPSAGARHPLECYLAVLRVDGVRPGLYRYADDVHALERVRAGMTSARLERYLGRQWWFASAAAVAFFVARVPKIKQRYAHPRAYRLLLLDAGHLCQTFCLTATWLRLAPFSTAALADSLIERDLGLDGIREIVLYAAGVGMRPESGYAQWPEHAPGRHYLRPRR